MLSTLAVLAIGLGLLAVLGLAARAAASARRADPDRDALRDRVATLLREHEAERARLAADARTARDEAERASRSRDELVVGVLHGLRAPLDALLGWARLLRSGRLDAAGTARAVETLERSASAQAQLLDDLLDVAQMERGELALDLRPVELVAVVEAAIAAVRPAAAAREIAIAAVLTPAVRPVAGDRGRLQQVVRNLLSNAVRHTPPGGRVEIRLEQDREGALLRVRNTGEGIAPASLPHVFERYHPSGPPAGAQGGAGLALAIVRHLVEAHGGTVSAESEGKGKGAAFTVRLPATAPPSRPQPGSAVRPFPAPTAEGHPGGS